MMKKKSIITMKKSTNRWMGAVIAVLIVATAAGCATDSELAEALKPGEDGARDEKITINVGMPARDEAKTRVAYDDGVVDAASDGSLTWQTDDQLAVAGLVNNTYIVKTDYTYEGADGATSGSFTGTRIANATQYNVYYPSTVTVDLVTGTATLPMTGQMQTADGTTDHLKNYLLLSNAAPIDDLNTSFTLEMKNSIMKFDLSGVPAEVGKLKSIFWDVETDAGTKSLALDFTTDAVTFSATQQTLTAYLAFMPEEMKVKAGGKFTVVLVGDNLYRAEIAVTAGKTYAPGMRYTAAIDGTSNTILWEDASDIVTMKMTVAVTAALGRGFNIPFPTTGETPAAITVDWGDGSTPTTVAAGTTLADGDAFNHTYTSNGTYHITITSTQADVTAQQMPVINFTNNRSDASNKKKLTSIDTPLLNMGSESLVNCFYDCTNLTNLPKGLFDKNTLVVTFYSCFKRCENLTTIPSGLFDKNTLVVDFYSCFELCSKLTAIPEGLFDKNTLVEEFYSCFSTCTNLTSIPAGLFDKNTLVTIFSRCFNNCGRLTTIPDGLFAKNTLATDFSYTFYMCMMLTLNENTFIDATNTWETRFNSLKEAVNFSSCFDSAGMNQSGNYGKAPELWTYNYGAGKDVTDCFYGINTNVSNFGNIPSSWK